MNVKTLNVFSLTVIIITYLFDNSEEVGFDVYNQGVNLQQNYEHQKQTEDRLHFFLEECDQLQVKTLICYYINTK